MQMFFYLTFRSMNTALLQRVKTGFLQGFQQNPVLAFAPGRINLIGEHTDYNEGWVFPAAIHLGIVAAIQKSDRNTGTWLALDVDEWYRFDPESIEPLSEGGWRNYVLGILAELRKLGKEVGAFNLAFGGDLPAGAGLSSSAALEVSVIMGLNELFDLGLGPLEMVLIAQQAEHQYAGVKCGIMDQYASRFGKENCALLLDCRTLVARVCRIDIPDFQWLLINSNVKHSLAESTYNQRRKVCEEVAGLLGIPALRDATRESLATLKEVISPEYYQQALYVIEENERVEQAAAAITLKEWEMLGAFLYQSHQGLSSQYRVSCDELDFLVEATRDHPDIMGARMMGGGFGGCTLNFIRKEVVKDFQDQITRTYQERFHRNCSFYPITLSDGARILSRG